MARIRTIKPELPSDQRLSRCSIEARYVFICLITQADDYGLMPAAPRQVLGSLFPNDEHITIEQVGEWLHELHENGVIEWRWRVDGGPVVQLVGWEKHQRVDNRRKPVLLNELDDVRRDSPNFAANRRESPRNSARTSDLRPPTSDLGPPTSECGDLRETPEKPAARKRTAPKGSGEKLYPHFGQEERVRCVSAFRKLGAFESGRVIKAVGPFFRAPDDPDFLPHDKVAFAVEDYCGVVSKGRSAPFASPEDCAKKLGALARNCVTYEWDALGRLDAQLLAIHGSTKLAA